MTINNNQSWLAADAILMPLENLQTIFVSICANLGLSALGLKILSFLYRGVPVQVRPGAPTLFSSNQIKSKITKGNRHLGGFSHAYFSLNLLNYWAYHINHIQSKSCSISHQSASIDASVMPTQFYKQKSISTIFQHVPEGEL